MPDLLTADRAGLCSVTLRALPVEQVVAYAVDAGLRCIEWGADVHAPPADRGRLRAARELASSAGLRICSYGSYWRAGAQSLDDVRAVIRGAVALDTDRIRIWAGVTGTAQADPELWSHVVGEVREAAAIAADHGCSLAFEFHGGTLTDSVPGTLRLLTEVDRANVSTYWQPPVDVEAPAALEGLRALLDVISAVHVFSWWPGSTRRPLSDRAQLWEPALDLLGTRARPVDLLLEFVPDDDPARLAAEAATLLDWLA